jgi:hypothetical protein
VQTLANPGSGPTVTNTQQKINDIDVDLLQAQSDITNLQSDVSTLQQDVSDLQAIETFVYLGAWDASTNTPTIADGDGAAGAGPGGVYRVSVAGSQDLGSGTIDFNAADRVVYNSAGVYEKWDVTDEVTSVNGQQGDVVLELDDIDDVDAAAPANDQALVWDAGNSKWEAKDIPRDADAVAYDNTTSGLTATDVQGAIDEVEGRLDTAEGSISTAQGDIIQLQTDLSNLELDDLTDVDLSTAPTDGQVLTYENATTSWKAQSLPPPVADLDDLTDVNAPSPNDNDALVWDAVASEWQPKNPFVTGNNQTAAAENTYILTLRDKTSGVTAWDDFTDNLTKEFSGKDANGIFTTVEWFDKSNNLRKRSVLSGTSPTYSGRAVDWFDTDGITIIRSESYALSYDGDDDLISEELI